MGSSHGKRGNTSGLQHPSFSSQKNSSNSGMRKEFFWWVIIQQVKYISIFFGAVYYLKFCIIRQDDLIEKQGSWLSRGRRTSDIYLLGWPRENRGCDEYCHQAWHGKLPCYHGSHSARLGGILQKTSPTPSSSFISEVDQVLYRKGTASQCFCRWDSYGEVYLQESANSLELGDFCEIPFPLGSGDFSCYFAFTYIVSHKCHRHNLCTL